MLHLKVEHYLDLVLGVVTARTVMLKWLSTSLEMDKPQREAS